METQDFNKKLMDYIYGEMESAEKKDFEKKLSEDEELRKEFEALDSVRQKLGRLSDKEVMEPFSTWRKQRTQNWFGEQSRRKMIVFRPYAAIAASLVILMILGYLTNFSISINNQGLFLGFNNQVQNTEEKSLSKDEINALVQNAVDANNEQLQSKIVEAENSYQHKLVTMETSLTNAINAQGRSVVSNEDLQQFFTNAEDKNMELMRDYFKLTTTQQQEYFKTMLTQFNDFVQEQRSEDLTTIANSLLELRQNQQFQKQETDNVLASLISSVKQNKN